MSVNGFINDKQAAILTGIIAPFADDSPPAVLAVVQILLKDNSIESLGHITVSQFRTVRNFASGSPNNFQIRTRAAYRQFREQRLGQLKLPGIDT